MNNTLKKILVSLGCAATSLLVWKVVGSWFPFMDKAYTAFGFTGLGISIGAFCYDEIVEKIKENKDKVKNAIKISDDQDETDEDEEEYEDEKELVEENNNKKQDEVANIFHGAFYLEDDYYKDIITWYRNIGTFKEAREIYCKSKGLEFDPTGRTSWDIDFFKDAIITIVDVCSDRIMETATCDADIATIINNIAYKMVYDAAYYTIVNGMTCVDPKNIINSIYKDEEAYSFEERKEIVGRLCSITGVVNPLTNKHVTLNQGDENGKGRIIQFSKKA